MADSEDAEDPRAPEAALSLVEVLREERAARTADLLAILGGLPRGASGPERRAEPDRDGA